MRICEVSLLHDAIDIFCLIVGVLGLVPLWREQSRRAYAIGFTVLMVAGGLYLALEYRKATAEKRNRDEVRTRSEIRTLELISNALCDGDMGIDELNTRLVSDTDSDRVSLALAYLQEGSRTITAVQEYVDSPMPPKRKVPMRVYHLTDRKVCQATP
jgi:hypothetical protein